PPAWLSSRRRPHHRRIRHQRPIGWSTHWSLSRLGARVSIAIALALAGCDRASLTYEGIRDEASRGQFELALTHVNQALQTHTANDEQSWRLKILKAQILLWRKQPDDALSVLRGEPPPSLARAETAGKRKILQGMAHRIAQRFAEADTAFAEAENM